MTFKVLSNLNHNGQIYKIGETIEGEVLELASLIANKVIVAAEKFDEAIKAREQEISAAKPDVTPASPVVPDTSGKGEDENVQAPAASTNDSVPNEPVEGAENL